MIRKPGSWLVLLCTVFLFLGVLARSSHAHARKAPRLSAEEQLIQAIELARYGKARDGLAALEKLIRAQPNFRLAQLVYAELLMLRSGRAAAMVSHEDPRVRELFEEAQLRLDQARFSPLEGSVPSAVLQISAEYPYVVLVDLPRARLHLMRNDKGELSMVGSRYVSIGKAGFGKQTEGDLRTPVGVYRITGWMGDESLPELYGTGALPLNYPNLWDRFKSKTGYGIWLHGVPRQTYVRGPRSSEGCVTLANEDLLWLKHFVLGSRAPVVLSDELQWVPQSQIHEEREAILNRIEDWRRAWASRDTEALLGFYSQDLGDGSLSRTQFTPARARVASGIASAGIKLSELSLFQYPGEPMLLADFKVDYTDEDHHFTSRKEQFWRKDASGQWRIFREENR